MEISSISSTLDRCEINDKNHKISKFRNYASQIYAALATNIVKLTCGSSIGFTSVLIAELYKDDAEIRISVSDITWFSSYFFMSPVGAFVLGALSQRIGSRSTMLISMTFYTIAYLTFYFATSSSMLLGTQAIVGIFVMTAVGPGINYVVEITQPQLRSALTASTTLTTMCAAFLVVLLSNFLHWRTIALVMLAFPVTGFLAVCTIPESPHWLASKNRFQEAETALSWLRGWSSSENVVSEFNELKKTYAKPLDNSSSLKTHINHYFHRSFYVPLSLICLLFVLHSCTGYNTMMAYCIVIFKQINAPIDSHVAASIFDAMRIMGALVCIFSINYTGKKKLLYFSLIGSASTFLTGSMALLLLQKYQIYPEICQWVAAIAMILTTFFTSAGIDKIVYILNAEIFPTRYRNVGTGIGLFTSNVTGALISKIFLSLEEAVTLSGIFAIFGISCIVTCTMYHFIFPETEGKTLQEIAESYAVNKRLGKKEKADEIREVNFT